MAIVTRYVDTDVVGGSADGTSWANAYASLSAWEAGEGTDLVTDGDSHVCYCRGVAADTTVVSINGFITDATHTLTIIGDNTLAYYNTSAYRLERTAPGNYHRMFIGDTGSGGYHTYQNLQGKLTMSGYLGCQVFRDLDDHNLFENCIAIGVSSGGESVTDGFNLGSGGSATDVEVRNCIADGIEDSTTTNTNNFGFNLLVSTTGGGIANNCTAVNCGVGFTGTYQKIDYVNCLSQSHYGTDYLYPITGASSHHNQNEDGSAPNTNETTGTVTFDNNYQPQAGDSYAGSGYDNSGSYTTDIAGVTRAAWTRGAVEEPASGTEVTPASVTIVLLSVAPTTQLGSLSVTPTPVAAVMATVAPTLEWGSITVTPTPAAAVMATVAPTLEWGSLSLTPPQVTAVLATEAPTTQLGSLSVTPTPVAAVMATVAPSIAKGSITVTPTPAAAVMATEPPTLDFTSISISGKIASAIMATAAPTVSIVGATEAATRSVVKNVSHNITRQITSLIQKIVED